ncbi:hypothetical protein MWU77_24230, partial [Rhodococcus sp. F64268]|uniref:DUF7373 family lipoprotein n=1 Tax=Rhodococcus sp. F64268 TaxID=2926402 RepID=UPI001FF4ECE5
YRTEPRDYAAEGLLAGDYGPAVEGQRLAEYVIHPHAIDPALTTVNGVGVTVDGTDGFLRYDAKEAIEPFGLISGFHSFRRTPDHSRQLGIAVWRFPTEQNAGSATQVLHDTLLSRYDVTDGLSLGPETSVALPQVPGTLASTYRHEKSYLPGETHTVRTFTARGTFVIYTQVDETVTDDEDPDTTWATDTTVRAVQQQQVLLDRFPATATEQIATLSIDVDKVLGRAVGFLDSEPAYYSDAAVYGPAGWLHFASHPARTRAVFKGTGTDRVAMLNSTVYRTGSDEGALTLRDEFAEITLENYPDLIEDASAPQNVPGTTCWTGDVATGRMSVCLMVYGRYMAELSGRRPLDDISPDTLGTFPQRVAAQYTKFVRAEELGLGEN